MLKRYFSRMFKCREHHSHYPERNYIVTCYKDTCRIEVIKFFCLIRPAKCWERPQCRWEPCIKSIRVLTHFLAALRANCAVLFCNNNFAAIVTIESRYSVSPPKLTWNTPITNIFKPVEIHLFKMFRNKLCITVLNCVNSRLCKRLHFYKPLLWNDRLNSCTATVTLTYVMAVILNLYKKSFVLKVLNHCLTTLISVHTLILAGIWIHRCVIIHNLNLCKVVTLTDFKVIRVVCRSDFNTTCTKFFINIFVRNNRDFTSDKRKNKHFTY